MGQEDSASGGPRPPRILFVDDEPLVLRTLRRSMSSRELSFQCEFAESGEAALELLAGSDFDVVVTDMQMPRMDGAALLRRVQERRPDIVRVVLSGHADPRAVFRAVPVAHQFLTKPFETRELTATLARALELRALIGNSKLRALIGGGSLPGAPATYTALTRLLSSEETSLDDVVTLVERDAPLGTRVSQLAANASLDVPRTVTTLSGYVRYLGVDALKSLVLAVETVAMFAAPGARLPGGSVAAFERQSVLTGQLARRILASPGHGAEAFAAGVLHDIGQLVLASRAPDGFAEALERSRSTKTPTWVAERDVLGASHAEAGACLLGLWGLPLEVVHAVARHHDPKVLSGGELNVAMAVYVANLLVEDPELPIGANGAYGLDEAWLGRLKPDVEHWRTLARDCARQSADASVAAPAPKAD